MKPTQERLYESAIESAIIGDIRLEVSRPYGSTVNVAQMQKFQANLKDLEFLTGHEHENAGELIRIYKIPEAYSILRVNQMKANPLVKFLESPVPGLVRCVLE